MSKSLFSVTPDPLTGGGIFSALQSLDPPWVEEDIALQLDMSYYGNISGGKVVSPLIDRILTASKLSTADMATLAGVIMAINKERWSREWATRSAEYDPIQNYNMTEEMTDDETVTEYGRSHTRTDNLAHTETRTDNLTRTIDNQEVTTPNLTSTSQQATRGFNSNSDVNTDKETATNTGTNRVDTDGTEHNTGTQGTTGSNTGTQTDADTGSDTSTRNYTLTRSGNIGVTTSQQMLQSERDLWMWSYFYDVIFPDVDDVLTIPVYADGEDADGTGGGIIPTGTIAITANGDYEVTYYANASVAVPNTYTESDEGKVVDGGQLVAQTNGSITTNGTHNTLLLGSVDVNVPNSYTESDEGKVVSSGALVAQTGPLVVTENGLIDTTTISSVNVAIPPKTIANYDFTQSLVDSVNGFTAVLRNNATRDDSGVHITAATGYVTTPNRVFAGMKMDLEITGSVRGGSDHARLVMFSSDSGLIYRSTGVWAFYAFSGWCDSSITEFNYFDNHVLRIFIDSTYHWHIYRDSDLVFEPNQVADTGGPLWLGSSSNSFYTTTIKSLKVYI